MVADQHLDDVFHALADPTRRAMLHDLSKSEHTVGELAAPFEISLAGASKHIQMLERAGLIAAQHPGPHPRLPPRCARRMHAGTEWIRHYEKYWNHRLDALEGLLEAEAAAASPRRKRLRGNAGRHGKGKSHEHP